MTDKENSSLIQNVGIDLRNLRKERNLTIDQLAQESGVSAITISNIENGRSNPTLNSLWKLSEALSVPLTKILGYATKPTIISSYSESYFINDLNNGWVVQPIFQEENIEVFRVSLKGKCANKVINQTKGSIEIITVMKGDLILKVGEQQYHLSTFDSINFDSGMAHEYINPSEEDLFLNIVVKYRSI